MNNKDTYNASVGLIKEKQSTISPMAKLKQAQLKATADIKKAAMSGNANFASIFDTSNETLVEPEGSPILDTLQDSAVALGQAGVNILSTGPTMLANADQADKVVLGGLDTIAEGGANFIGLGDEYREVRGDKVNAYMLDKKEIPANETSEQKQQREFKESLIAHPIQDAIFSSARKALAEGTGYLNNKLGEFNTDGHKERAATKQAENAQTEKDIVAKFLKKTGATKREDIGVIDSALMNAELAWEGIKNTDAQDIIPTTVGSVAYGVAAAKGKGIRNVEAKGAANAAEKLTSAAKIQAKGKEALELKDVISKKTARAEKKAASGKSANKNLKALDVQKNKLKDVTFDAKTEASNLKKLKEFKLSKERSAAISTNIAKMEAAGNANEVYNTVMGIDNTDLEKDSGPYRKLIADGVEPEKAKQMLANQAAAGTLGASALFSKLAAKATGTKLEEGIAGKGTGYPGVVAGGKKLAGESVGEAIEESIQTGSGELAKNIGLKNTVDDDKNVAEGVAMTTGEAAALGALSAGGMAVVGSSASKGKDATVGLSKLAADPIKDKVRKVSIAAVNKTASPEMKAEIKDITTRVDSIDTELKTAIDTQDEDALFDVADKNQALQQETFTKQSQLAAHKADLVSKLEKATPEEAKEIKKELRIATKEHDTYAINLESLKTKAQAINTALDTALSKQARPVDDIIKDISDSPKAAPQKAIRELEKIMQYNPDAISEEQANIVLDLGSKGYLKSNLIKVLQSDAALRRQGKSDTANGVAQDKIEGSKTHTGLKEYRNSLYQALLGDDTTTVDDVMTILDRLHSWAEGDNTRTALVEKGLEGDKTALAVLSKYYGVSRFSPKVARTIITENKAISDTYTNLAALAGEVMPSAKGRIPTLTPKTAPNLKAANTSPASSGSTSTKTEPVKGILFKTGHTNTPIVKERNKQLSALPEAYNSIQVKVNKGETWFESTDDKGEVVDRVLPAELLPLIQLAQRGEFSGVIPEDKMITAWNEYTSEGLSNKRKEEIQGMFLELRDYIYHTLKKQGIKQKLHEYVKTDNVSKSTTPEPEAVTEAPVKSEPKTEPATEKVTPNVSNISEEPLTDMQKKTDVELKAIIESDTATEDSEISPESYEAYAVLNDRGITDLGDVHEEPVETGTLSEGLVEKDQEEITVENQLFAVPETEDKARVKQLNKRNSIKELFTFGKGNLVNTVSNLFSTLNSISILQLLPNEFFQSDTPQGTKIVGWENKHDTALTAYEHFRTDGEKSIQITKTRAGIESDLAKILKNGVEDVVKKDAAYNFYAADLLTADGKLPDNVWEAAILANYQWLTAEGVGTLFTSDDDIKRILNLQKFEPIPKGARKLLAHGGVHPDFIEEALGRNFMAILGLHVADKAGTDKSAPEKLSISLGKVALRMAKDSGMLVNGALVKDAQLDEWRGITKSEAPGKTQYLILPHKGKGINIKPVGSISDMIEAEKGSGYLMGNVLTGDKIRTLPQFSKKAIESSVPNTMKGTLQRVPAVLKKIIAKHAARPHQLKVDTYEAYAGFDQELRLEMYGFVPQEEINTMPFHKREGAEAHNKSIILELNQMDDFVAQIDARSFGRETNFYLPHEVWRNMRMGMSSSTINTQRSKLHRHLVGLKQDIAKLNLRSTSRKDVRKNKDFLLAVALGFGISIDKKREKTSLSELDSLVQNTQSVHTGIVAMQSIQSGENSPENQAAVLSAVKSLGEKMHSFEALSNYAKYLTALENNQGTVDVSLTAETDGMTNGPALGLFLMGGLATGIDDLKELLNAAGFKFGKMPFSHGEWKEQKGTLDLYEQSAKKITEGFNELNMPLANKQALAHFMGTLGTDEQGNPVFIDTPRDFPKESTVGSSYGQGGASVKRYAGTYGLERVLDMLTSDPADFEMNKKKLTQALQANLAQQLKQHTEDLKKDVNAVTKKEIQEQIKTKQGTLKLIEKRTNALDFKTVYTKGLDSETEGYIKKAYESTYGELLNGAISSNFAGLQKATKAIGVVSAVTHAKYESVLAAAIQAKKDELDSDPDQAFNSLYDDLSKEQYDAVLTSVQKDIPAIKSQFTNNTAEEGIRVGKSRRQNTEDANGTASNAHLVGAKGFGSTYVKERINTNPGISGMAASIHSLDATIMYKTLDKFAVGNIFDAILSGVSNIHTASQQLNRATLEVLKKADPLADFYGQFQRSGGFTDNFIDTYTDEELGMFSLNLWEMFVQAPALESTLTLEKMTPMLKGTVSESLVKGMLANVSMKGNTFPELIFKLDKEFAQGLMLDLIKNSPASMTEEVDNVLAALVAKNNEVKSQLLKDLTYVVQYNKEDAGIKANTKQDESDILDDVDETSMEDLTTSFLDHFNTPATWAVEPEVVKEVAPTNKKIQESLVTQSLIQVMGNVDPNSELGKVLKTMLDTHKSGAPTENLQKIAERITDPADRKILAGVTTYAEDGRIVSVYPRERTEAEQSFIATMAKHVQGGAIIGKAKVTEFVKDLVGKDELMLKHILPLVPEGIQIQVLSANKAKWLRNKLGDKEFNNLNTYYGMYHNGTVYLNANQVDYSGMRKETLFHELIHAALMPAGVVTNFKGLDLATRQRITEAKINLERLRKDLLKNPAVNSQFGNALTNIDELLAWGLSNKAFQAELKKIKYTAKTSYWGKFESVLRKVFSIGNTKYSAFSQLLEGAGDYIAIGNQINTSSTPAPQAATTNETQINEMNAEAIFDSLSGTNDRDYDGYLKDLMGKVANQIVAPITLMRQQNNMSNLGASLRDKIILSTFNGQAPVPMKGLGSYGFKMSEQEVYVNQLLNTALADSFADSSRLGARAQKLYQAAKKRVTPEDLRTSPSETTDQLQIKHDSIFGVNTNAEGAIHPIREFIALARTNKQLRNVLSTITVPKAFDVVEGTNLLDKIINFVNAAMISFFGKWDSLPVGGTVTEQMDKISNQLLSIETSHKSKLFSIPEKALVGSSKSLDSLAKTSYALMTKMVKSDSALGNYTNTLGDFFNTKGANLGYAAIAMNKLIMGKGRLNFAGMFVNQMMGEVDANADLQNDKFHRMLRHFKASIDTEGQERKGIVINELKKALGKRLTPEQSNALTSTVIRSDLASLVRDGVTPSDLVSLMQSELLLDSKIASYENLLGAYVVKGTQTYHYYLNGAQAMAIEMITGEVTQPNTVSNAKRLMEMDGMPNAKPVISERVEEILDSLGSLYALREVPVNEKIAAADILVDHVNRPDDSNGFTYMLSLHEAMQQDAKREQFKTNPKDFIKGYTPDTVNSGKDLKYGFSKADPVLLKAGYTFVREMPKDFRDPSVSGRYLYVHPDAGLNKYVQGVAYLHDNKAKGDSLFKYQIDHADQTTAIELIEELANVTKSKQKDLLRMYYAPTNSKAKRRTYMKPTYDTKGNITDYRYTVPAHIKDQVLERDNDVTGVLGNMANINHVSPKTEEANQKLVDALAEQLQIDTAKGNLKGYIRLSNTAHDRKLRDAYRLLPESTRSYARSVFGTDDIPVRNDLYDIIIGSRKWSIRDVWGEDAQTKRSVAYVVSKVLDGITLGHGERLAPMAEKGIMEAVSKAKDIIVNLSVSVLTDNVTSNTNYLVSRGLTMGESVNWQTEGINEAKAYLKLKSEKIALELRITGEYAADKHRDYAKRIQEIDVLMDHNKARPLVEEGLLSTIAEELENTVDKTNSYATKLSKFLDKKVGVNSKTRDALHGVAVSQETEIYKVLSGLTQFSDFGARYALMKKTMNRKENALTFKQASSDAMRAFVNYDLPMHPAMQYASDIGILWFPRWMISMQRTITHGFAENPSRVIMLAVAHMLTGGLLPSVYGSLWGMKNPLDSVGFIDRLMSGYGLHPALRVF